MTLKEKAYYDKNRNPIKTKYKAREWPFKTKKAAKEAFDKFEEVYGRSWYYYEGWTIGNSKNLPWITQFHPDYKQYKLTNLRRKRERQVRRDSK